MAYRVSINGIKATLRSYYIFVSHGVNDVNEIFTRNRIEINLSHSTYPIKDMTIVSNNEECLSIRLLNFLYNLLGYGGKPAYAITSSDFTVKATQYHYKINNNKILPLGFPKSVLLLNSINNKKNNNKMVSDFF